MTAKQELIFALVVSAIWSSIVFAVTHRAGLASLGFTLLFVGIWIGWWIYKVMRKRGVRP